MLSKLFSNIKLGVTPGLIILAVSFWTLLSYTAHLSNTEELNFSFWLISGISFTLLILTGFVTFLLFDNRFNVTRRNYFAPAIFGLLVTLIPSFYYWQISLLLLLNVLLYFVFYLIGKSNNEDVLGLYMHTGALAFLACLISPIGYLYLIIIFWHSILNGRLNLRNLVLPFFSFVLYFLIGWGVSYLFNIQASYLRKFNLNIDLLTIESLQENKAFLIISGVLLIFSLLEYLQALRKAPVLKRKVLTLLFFNLLIAIIAFVFFGINPETKALFIFPLSVMFANFLQYVRKPIIQEMWVWLVIAASILLSILT